MKHPFVCRLTCCRLIAHFLFRCITHRERILLVLVALRLLLLLGHLWDGCWLVRGHRGILRISASALCHQTLAQLLLQRDGNPVLQQELVQVHVLQVEGLAVVRDGLVPNGGRERGGDPLRSTAAAGCPIAS